MPPLSNLAARDVETLVHPYTNLASFRDSGPIVFERGEGVYVYDSDGKPYIEGMAGLWCTALGYGNEELVEAAAAQMRKLSFGHLFTGKSHDPAIELAEKLKDMAPVPISKVFFCNSGSEANDSQVKFVWYLNNALGRPQKKKIVSRVKAYHGVIIPLSYRSTTTAFHLLLPVSAPCPHHYRFANAIILTDVNVAKYWREALRASTCARFSTVLGPGSDGSHEQHIHVDLAERRGGYKMCEWDVREPVKETAAKDEQNAAKFTEPVPLPRPRPVASAGASPAKKVRSQLRW